MAASEDESAEVQRLRGCLEESEAARESLRQAAAEAVNAYRAFTEEPPDRWLAEQLAVAMARLARMV